MLNLLKKTSLRNIQILHDKSVENSLWKQPYGFKTWGNTNTKKCVEIGHKRSCFKMPIGAPLICTHQ